MENVVVMENVFYKVRKKIKIILNAFYLFIKLLSDLLELIKVTKIMKMMLMIFFIFFHSTLPFF